jgi:hypothetical protein
MKDQWIVRILLAVGLLGTIGGAALAQTTAPGGPARAAVPVEDDSALLEKTCAGCHALDQVVSQRHDAAEWDAIVQQMLGYGASASPDEAARITRYLTAHHGKQDTSPAATQP